MSNKTLYELTKDAEALFELLFELDGELSEENERAYDEFWAEFEANRDRKLESIGYVIRDLLGRAEIIDAEINRLTKRKTALFNNAARLKARVHENLKATGEQKVETTTFTFRRQKNGGKVPVVLDPYYAANPVELPERYRKVEFKPDLERIREDLESSDIDLTEVRSIANFGDKGEHLRIS